MNPIRSTKNMIKEAFPSLWLRWHLMHRPRTAEVELSLLHKVVPADAVTVDVGANCGLYTRELAQMSKCVHAFEPSSSMADILRQTSADNVQVHEVALSDHEGQAALFIPAGEAGLIHGLASIEPQAESFARPGIATSVPTARLDDVIRESIAFVKIDVEGHELSVLNGAIALLDQSQPVFLVEAEDRHRAGATQSVFEFFESRSYDGYFLDDGDVVSVDHFDVELFQDAESLLPNGGRKQGRSYVNNFFFFPSDQDGYAILSA